MTTSKCTYCGEHHHYQHELVCDNVHQLCELPMVNADHQALIVLEDIDKDEEIKSLKNDYLQLNTNYYELLKRHRSVVTELDLKLREVKSLKVQLIQGMATKEVSGPQE
jgi:hypothetical protein